MASREQEQQRLARLSRALLLPVAGTACLLAYLLARNVASKLPVDGFTGYEDYNFSEWMIDWSAGFVRRGLGGEVVHPVASAIERLGIAAPVGVAIWLTAVVGLALFCALFVYIVIKQRSLPMAVRLGLCASPVGLAFVALNADEILKKDAWVLALCLGLFPVVASCAGAASKKTLLIVQLMLALVAILLHELAMLICAPAMAYLLEQSLRDLPSASRRRLAIGYLATLGGGGLAVIASPRLSGDMAKAMCVESARALSTTWDCMNLNEYAFGQATWTLAEAWGETLANLALHQNAVELPALLVTACLHLFLCSLLLPRAHRRQLVVWLVAAAVISLPAFVFAGDWGRFAYMFVTTWTVAILTSSLQFTAGNGDGAWREWQAEHLHGAVVIAGAMLGGISVLVRVNVCCTSDLISMSPIWEALMRILVR